ncbi:hypothetical protein SDC9_180497 [bioreactor metagenome]|uniref:Uncharacterized protein n=1 Tax=bioreactor metagenome TaxID=1076179 RepID=A0A645HA82_9ZZZZ
MIDQATTFHRLPDASLRGKRLVLVNACKKLGFKHIRGAQPQQQVVHLQAVRERYLCLLNITHALLDARDVVHARERKQRLQCKSAQ